MEVSGVQSGQQAAAAQDDQQSAETEAAFAKIVGSIALGMVMRQMSFTKQTVSESFNDE